jgi:hypothetical protein
MDSILASAKNTGAFESSYAAITISAAKADRL